MAIKLVFTANNHLQGVLNHGRSADDWRLDCDFEDLNDLLNVLGNPQIHSIPRDWTRFVLSIATHGFSLHDITLFHLGRDLSNWIMKVLLANGISL